MVRMVSHPKQLLDQTRRKGSCPHTGVAPYTLRPLLYDACELLKLRNRQLRGSSEERPFAKSFQAASSVLENPVLKRSPTNADNLGSSALARLLTHQQQPLNAQRHVQVFSSPCHLILLAQPLRLCFAESQKGRGKPHTSPGKSVGPLIPRTSNSVPPFCAYFYAVHYKYKRMLIVLNERPLKTHDELPRDLDR